jgi:hypothetical protein
MEDFAGEKTELNNKLYISEITNNEHNRKLVMNLMKFEGVQLPGGVTLNGRQFYEDATREITELKDAMRLEAEMPIDFFVG